MILCRSFRIKSELTICNAEEASFNHQKFFNVMNISFIFRVGRLARLGMLVFAGCLFVSPVARAGLVFNLQLYQYGNQDGVTYTYYFDPQLNTNTTAPSVPFGSYYLTSFGIPTNGSSSQWQYDTNGFYRAGSYGTRNSYGDYNSMLHELTNGLWTLYVTNSTATNVYHFTVKVNITSNDLPKVLVTYPANGAVNVTNQPTFAWQGPSNYSTLVVGDFNNNNLSLPVTQTNYTDPLTLYQGLNTFNIDYQSNSVTAAVASTPTNALLQPFSGWVSTSTLIVTYGSQFSVGLPDTSGTYRSLVAYYPFDETDGAVLGAAALDASGNGYNLTFSNSFGSFGGVNSTTDSVAGIGALVFQDSDFNSGGVVGWTNPTPPVLLSTLAGSFSVSCWVKTTQNVAWNTAPAYYGAGLVSADVAGQANDVIPIALTGGAVAFNTGGSQDITLNSQATVNDGNYHHIVVTRNQLTGQKIIYIDGNFDSFSSGTTNLLSDPQKLTIGALANAGDPDPTDGGYYQGYDGELDDLQIYDGVLSANDVAALYNNPGTALPSGATPSGGHIAVAHYTFDNSGDLGEDFTTNQNNIDGCYSTWGTYQVFTFTTNAVAGGGAVQFVGDSSMTPCGQSQCFSNWEAALVGSFTFSAWVKTTNIVGNDSDGLGYNNGQTVIFFNGGLIPMGITGSKAAFFTGSGYGGDTLHSTNSVTTGTYTHIVVTRDENSGQKAIYINGVLDSTDYGQPGTLADGNYASIGGIAGSAYVGNVDDVQLYSGVLNASEVAYLYANPGLMVTNTAGSGLDYFNFALGTTNLNWNVSGDTSWFVEATNTSSGSSFAAQSGSVTNEQSSTLSVTVTGPGTLTFSWSSIANDPHQGFTCNFYDNGNQLDNIGGDSSWYQDGPFQIGAGQHILTWTAYANGDTDPTQAAYLDMVNYTPVNNNSAPIITLNPVSQTNYPGYSVALFAAATSNPTATFQWYEVGDASSIADATNALFIPTNSGTAGVAGSYYAIASNPLGSAFTTTAAVTFVSAPQPANWARVFRSPFFSANDNFYRDYNGGCAVDSAGDVYVANQYIGDINLENNQFSIVDTFTAVGVNGGAALIKYADSNGPVNTAPLVWAVGLTNNDPASYSYGLDVALAPGNGAYFAAEIFRTNWLGTNRFADNGSGSILLSRFDVNGSNVWSQFITGPNLTYTSYNMLASDSSGDVTVAGEIFGTTAFGGTNLSAPSGSGFIAQYNSNGSVRWAQTVPDYIFGLASGAGRLYASLQATVSGGVTNVSIGGLSNLTDRAWAVACLNATNGQALWLRGVGDQFGADTTGLINDMPLVSTSGTNVFFTGNAYGDSVAFGGLSVSLPGGSGQYFARYDTDGNPQSASAFGSPTTMIWASAANSAGVYVDGDFDGYSGFGNYFVTAPEYVPSPIGNQYFTQPFVAKFDLNGNPLWARNGVSPVMANFRGIATTSGGVWASGFLQTTNELYNGIVPAQFGTNFVASDATLVGSPIGSLVYSVGGLMTKITDSSAAASPVRLIDLLNSGGNFQFSFTSESGFTHYVQYRTNLVSGVWQNYTNLPGDGTLKSVSVPLSIFNGSKQGYVSVTTQ
jgi:hypothetical protein